jgi:hypothetical protein
MASHCILWLGFAWCRFGRAWCNVAMHATSLAEDCCRAHHFGFAFSLVLVLTVYSWVSSLRACMAHAFWIHGSLFDAGPPSFFFGWYVCFSLRLRGFCVGAVNYMGRAVVLCCLVV